VADEFLDATTYLVSKVKYTGMDGKANEVLFSDYKETDGIKFPKTMEIVGGQMGTLTFITDKVKVNTPVDEKLFKKAGK
jgi:hypothetical protein